MNPYGPPPGTMPPPPGSVPPPPMMGGSGGPPQQQQMMMQQDHQQQQQQFGGPPHGGMMMMPQQQQQHQPSHGEMMMMGNNNFNNMPSPGGMMGPPGGYMGGPPMMMGGPGGGGGGGGGFNPYDNNNNMGMQGGMPPHMQQQQGGFGGNMSMMHEEPVNAPSGRGQGWVEYAAQDGRPYWSDGQNSSWTEPDEVRRLREAFALQPVPPQPAVYEMQQSADGVPEVSHLAIQLALEAAQRELDQAERKKIASAAAKSMTSKRSRTTPLVPVAVAEEEDEVEYDPKAAIAAFKAHLAAKRIGTTEKWSEAVRALSYDEAYKAVRTPGERKQAFCEYQTKLGNAKKEKHRLETKKAREGFAKLLVETVEITAKSRWKEADELLAGTCDDRYADLEESLRQELFKDHLLELAKAETVERKKKGKMKATNFAAFLREVPAESYFEQSTSDKKKTTDEDWAGLRWSRVEEKVLRPMKDDRYKALSSEERRREWLDFAEDMEKEAADKRKEMRVAIMTALRLALFDQLDPKESSPTDMAKEIMTWSEERSADDKQQRKHRVICRGALLAVRPGLKEVKKKGLEKAVGSTCLRILEDSWSDHRAERKADKKRLRELVDRLGPETETFESWLEALIDGVSKPKDAAWLKELKDTRPSNARRVFEGAVKNGGTEKGELTEKQDKAQRKKERKFNDLLTDHLHRSDHVAKTWEEMLPVFKVEAAFRAVPLETAKKLFDDHIQKLTRILKEKRAAKAEKEAEKEEQRAAKAEKEAAKAEKEEQREAKRAKKESTKEETTKEESTKD